MKVTYADIYDVIRLIPKGRVATYGQIAELAQRQHSSDDARMRRLASASWC
jgi:alkylated DNA nucleotide flippase Atl1